MLHTPDTAVAEDDVPVVRLLHKLLADAVGMGASDLHFEPFEHLFRVRLRLDGVLHELAQPPLSLRDKLATRLKILARLDIAEKRLPQDGKMRLALGTRTVDFRVSTLPTQFGEKIVLRILDTAQAALSISDLGYEPAQQEALLQAISKPHGLVLMTGPTGSGKTVSLYACLQRLNQPGVNIATAEDPVEINLPGINQVSINERAGLDFALALRAFLRQDPDVLMVGEIRDLETADIAVKASQTGHLVLSTLHTNDAPSAIIRMLDLGVPPYLIKATVLGVMAQRLVRRLCPHCKRPATVSATDWQRLTGGLLPLPAPGSVQEPVGCLECRETGYLGRVGLYEILTVDEALRGAIDGSSDSLALQRQALKSGMVPLRLAGARKAMEGLTSLADVAALTPEIAGR